ncbi:MAG: hypothetical protein RPR97_07230 [Colwellia sp.]|jgi:hypothetical protein
MKSKQPKDLKRNQTTFKVVDNILNKWSCSLEEKTAILDISEAECSSNLEGGSGSKFADETLERMSYILNIYECLAVLHQNPENRFGFLRLKNHSRVFNGATPLAYIIEIGSTTALDNVYKYLDGARHY